MAPKKKLKTEDFVTKEFHVYFPFETKEAACEECGALPCICEEPNGKVIKIKGMANFCGDLNNSALTFVDHCGDVMVPAGFDLSVWNKNPQILWQHDRSYTIGKGLEAVKKPNGLEVTAEIHEKAMEETDFYKIEQGLVKMFSVGFKTLAAEYRTIDDKEVFFITKSRLYEVSCVGIPMNSESGFSVIKSYSDGSFSAVDTTPTSTSPTVDAVHKPSNKDNKMQIKFRDMLPEDKVKELEDLGLGESLDELKDVDTASYIKSLVAKETQPLKLEIESIKAELLKVQETSDDTKSDEEDEPTSTEDESTDAPTETEEEKAAKEAETKALSDALTAASDSLKTLF